MEVPFLNYCGRQPQYSFEIFSSIIKRLLSFCEKVILNGGEYLERRNRFILSHVPMDSGWVQYSQTLTSSLSKKGKA